MSEKLLQPYSKEWWSSQTLTLETATKEWETVIKTQMHFNDLIIKYRTIVFSVFVSLAGALIALSRSNMTQISSADLNALGILLCAFWFFAFLIDINYYHQLLLASVKHAEKFDSNPYKIFGLTSTILNSVSVRRSNTMIVFFYFGPLVAATVVFLIVSNIV